MNEEIVWGFVSYQCLFYLRMAIFLPPNCKASPHCSPFFCCPIIPTQHFVREKHASQFFVYSERKSRKVHKCMTVLYLSYQPVSTPFITFFKHETAKIVQNPVGKMLGCLVRDAY